jgi:hypothetical protein
VVLTALLTNACQRGHTALLVAVNTDCAEVVDALVKAGADLEVEKGRAERVRAVVWCDVFLWVCGGCLRCYLLQIMCELTTAAEV